MSRTYSLVYQVMAMTEYEAIHKAARMLREEVHLIKTESLELVAPGWWKVTLRVSEDS